MEDISNSRQEDSQEANPDIQDSPSVSFQSFVKESKELNQLISNIEKDLLNDSLYSRCATIIEKYQEQPHLLDPHLAELVIPLLRLARENFHQAEILQKLLKLTYIFIKVRGFRVLGKNKNKKKVYYFSFLKTIIKLFSNFLLRKIFSS